MKKPTYFALFLATCVVTSFAKPLPIVWWSFVNVVDAHTVQIRSDKGEMATITLACVGAAKDEEAAIKYIRERLSEKRLSFWPLSTSETNWMSRPMCLFIDEPPPGYQGAREQVFHLPTLNEELLAKGYVAFRDVQLPYDEYGLKARLYRASTYAKRLPDKSLERALR